MNELLDIFFGLDHHSHNYVLFFQQVSKNHNAWLIFWQKLILSRVTGGVNLQLIQCYDKKWKWIQVHRTPACSLLPTKIFYLFRSSFQSDHDDATTTDWVIMSHCRMLMKLSGCRRLQNLLYFIQTMSFLLSILKGRQSGLNTGIAEFEVWNFRG